MDPIKKAFQKAKQDIESLKEDINFLVQDIQDIKLTLKALVEYESHKQELQQTNQQSQNPTNQHTNLLNRPQEVQYPTENLENPTQNTLNPSFQSLPTQEHAHYAIKQRFISTSTGNKGVPTNQPTIQQTNQHPLISYGNSLENTPRLHVNNEENTKKTLKNANFDKISHLEQVSNVLSTLDNIKKELRSKFKKLTTQEMLIFSAIYQLEEQGFIVDYSLLSQNLSLTEISIRDYIRKLLEKGVPIVKTKVNNKKIQLSISQDLKKIASLSTILTLREL